MLSCGPTHRSRGTIRGITLNKLICVAYIAGLTGLALDQVGEMPNFPEEPFSWSLPFIMFGLLATAAILGYRAGKEDR